MVGLITQLEVLMAPGEGQMPLMQKWLPTEQVPAVDEKRYGEGGFNGGVFGIFCFVCFLNVMLITKKHWDTHWFQK